MPVQQRAHRLLVTIAGRQDQRGVAVLDVHRPPIPGRFTHLSNSDRKQASGYPRRFSTGSLLRP